MEPLIHAFAHQMQITRNAIAMVPEDVIHWFLARNEPCPTKALAEILYRRETSSCSRVPFQKLLRLVDLGGEVRAAASVGVVEEHHSSVGLANLVLCDLPLAAN